MHKKVNLVNIVFAALIVIALIGCRSNRELHKDMTKDHWKHLVECNKIPACDTFRFNERTVAVKLDPYYIKVGSIKNGKEIGKWYYYYVFDSINCYKIKEYRKKDTVVNIVRYINPIYF